MHHWVESNPDILMRSPFNCIKFSYIITRKQFSHFWTRLFNECNRNKLSNLDVKLKPELPIS